jgi:3-phosphoshikimate 1-carboxyvinyltransferase
MSQFSVLPGRRIEGSIRVPGDKSISHRALMFGAIANGTTRITGFLPGEDCLSTLAAMRAMGIAVEQLDSTTLTVAGRGLHGLQAPACPLDMGNSGTAMRLLTGLLAGQSFTATLIGDESLSRRPMERVAAPLRRMGALIETREGRPPVRVVGRQPLTGITFDMPVASAQVKSAVLLAGLYASGETIVSEPATTRDHTERMMAEFGLAVQRREQRVMIRQPKELTATDIAVPGDFSSAVFPMVAACLAETGELLLENVGLNPSRTGMLEILRLMGARLEVEITSTGPGEPVGRIRVRPSRLRGGEIPPELVPLAIDEFPMVFVLAALAEGVTVVRGAEELRHKESDRIAVMAAGLRGLGITVDETPDGARITGGSLRGGIIDSRGDHRVAMAFAVGALRALGPVRILDTANVATSFPDFPALMRAIGLPIESDDCRESGH